MMFNEYQILAAKTAQYPDVFLLSTQQKNKSIKVPAIYASLGLAGEAGEFANKIKKVLRDTNGEISDELLKDLSKELGDVLWYVATCATELDLHFDNIAKDNIAKLFDRKERGVIRL